MVSDGRGRGVQMAEDVSFQMAEDVWFQMAGDVGFRWQRTWVADGR